jgi:hypothetical protein
MCKLLITGEAGEGVAKVLIRCDTFPNCITV